MAAGLRATAKAMEHPPEPTVGAPVLDPTPRHRSSTIRLLRGQIARTVTTLTVQVLRQHSEAVTPGALPLATVVPLHRLG
jgi:hypothetical protein